jgi:hypothetical protein
MSNRARYNLRRVLIDKGIVVKYGLKAAVAKTLINFMLGYSDMTISKLNDIATELGTDLFDMLKPIPEGEE